MAYKVIFAPAAIARLEDIVRYIAADNPSTAAAFALHLIERAELLADFPELGTAYRKRKNVRRLRCDPYFIYYRVKLDERAVDPIYWRRMQPPIPLQLNSELDKIFSSNSR